MPGSRQELLVVGDQPRVTVDGHDVLLSEQTLEGNYRCDSGDEWVVPVKWIRVRTRDQAIKQPGLFAYQNSATKLRNKFTLDTLTDAFGIDESTEWRITPAASPRPTLRWGAVRMVSARLLPVFRSPVLPGEFSRSSRGRKLARPGGHTFVWRERCRGSTLSPPNRWDVRCEQCRNDQPELDICTYLAS
jgi:hypothetical protein